MEALRRCPAPVGQRVYLTLQRLSTAPFTHGAFDFLTPIAAHALLTACGAAAALTDALTDRLAAVTNRMVHGNGRQTHDHQTEAEISNLCIILGKATNGCHCADDVVVPALQLALPRVYGVFTGQFKALYERPVAPYFPL